MRAGNIFYPEGGPNTTNTLWLAEAVLWSAGLRPTPKQIQHVERAMIAYAKAVHGEIVQGPVELDNVSAQIAASMAALELDLE